LKKSFIGRSHPIDDMYWSHLRARLGLNEERLDARLAETESRYTTEKLIQQRLFANPGLFRPYGLRLDMKNCEVRLPGGGIVDLLAWDRRSKRYVIIELKKAAADFRALGQVVAYRDTWQRRNPWIRRPLGLLVGDSLSPKIRDVVKRRRRVRFIALKDLGIVVDVP
jgi:RecB family endonuclease NucS